jgi:hypothetical protein
MELVDELKSMNAFLEARAVAVTNSPNTVGLNMVQGLVKKIESKAKFSTQDGVALYAALKDCSYLTSRNMAQPIYDAVDQKLAAADAPSLPCRSVRQPQMLTTIQNYLSHSDWALLFNPDCLLEDKKWVLIKRLQSLGLNSLHEQTVKACVGLLVLCLYKQSKSFPNAHDIFSMVQSFKASFDACRVPVSSLALLQYPATPKICQKLCSSKRTKAVGFQKAKSWMASMTLSTLFH